MLIARRGAVVVRHLGTRRSNSFEPAPPKAGLSTTRRSHLPVGRCNSSNVGTGPAILPGRVGRRTSSGIQRPICESTINHVSCPLSFSIIHCFFFSLSEVIGVIAGGRRSGEGLYRSKRSPWEAEISCEGLGRRYYEEFGGGYVMGSVARGWRPASR